MLDKTFAFLTLCGEHVSDPEDEGSVLLAAAMKEVKTMRTLPRIVCVCGPTRFINEHRDATLQFSVGGEIVLGIGGDAQYEGQEARITENDKAMLDALHFRKIDLADRVFVVNKNGYIGKSTYAEMKYAIRVGKPISFLEDKAWRWDTNHPQVGVDIHYFMDAARREVEREEEMRG